MTTVLVKKVLSKITKIETELYLLKKSLLETVADDNDDWLYEKPMVNLLKKRIKQARKEYREGKTISIPNTAGEWLKGPLSGL